MAKEEEPFFVQGKAGPFARGMKVKWEKTEEPLMLMRKEERKEEEEEREVVGTLES